MSNENSLIPLQRNNLQCPPSALVEHHRLFKSQYFIPTPIQISADGIVAMLIVDTQPEKRWVSYSDVNYSGIECGEGSTDASHSPVRRAHYIDTHRGFSLLKVFILPPKIEELFGKDRFLGEPFIEKCVLDGVFDPGIELDEERVWCSFGSVTNALDLITVTLDQSWKAAGMPEYCDSIAERKCRFRNWISFHAWFAFPQTIELADASILRALGNFDTLLAPRLAQLKA
ncbi:MAG: hypothetical protein JWO73_213 [Candidatus Taylorbacteria bacterium]|nr:hypothetical protein [Candidatus Taylorbacteria bacterium]